MFSQNTRLELVIVGAALLVLFVCRQPPKSGNADIRKDAGITLQEPAAGIKDGGRKTEDGSATNPQAAILSPSVPAGARTSPAPEAQPPAAVPPANVTMSDNSTVAPTALPQPARKRIGVVDARRCANLNYKDVMYGEVTVRWIWNGQKFVWRKVIEVKEDGGAVSIWTFGERNDVILSELSQEGQ